MSVAVELAPVTTRFDTIDASDVLAEALDEHRRELTGYCYRMLGSAFEAEDAVQETMVRAWQGHRHASRAARPCARGSTASPPTSASTCCAAASAGPGRWTSARPRPPRPSAAPRCPRTPGSQPIPDGRVLPEDGDPAEVAAARESIRLAFVAALQHLPARQRAVLILREVLRWQATEVAELLDTTVASVNSALQRARATLAERDLERRLDRPHRRRRRKRCWPATSTPSSATTSPRSSRCCTTTPSCRCRPTTSGCGARTRWASGSSARAAAARAPAWCPRRPTAAPAFGSYRPDGQGGHAPCALQVIEISGGPDRRPPQLPRPGAVRRCSGCPSASDPAGGATAVTTTPHQPSSSSRPTRDASAPCTSMAQPSRRAASWQRARRSASARSGRSAPASGQLVTSRPSAVTTTTVVRPGCCTLVRRRGRRRTHRAAIRPPSASAGATNR